MEKRIICACLGVLALGACADPFAGDTTLTKVAAAGLRAATAPSPEVDVAYAQGEFVKVPTLDKSGNPIRIASHCSQTSTIPTYNILNGNASASASAASPNGASGAIAVNSGSMTGEAAVAEAQADVAQRVGQGYDVWRAYDDCSHTSPKAGP